MALPIQSTPTYRTTLPSNGQEVEYRPFLVKEQKILVMARESQKQDDMMRSVKKMIDATTFEKLDVDELAMVDLEWLFVKIRSVSIGETSKLVLNCENKECFETHPYDLNLEEIDIVGSLPDDSKVMINDDVGLTLRVPSVKDLNNIDKLDDNMKAVEIVKRCIVNIFDSENVYEGTDLDKSELNEFVDSLTFGQLELIGSFFDDLPKLSHEYEYTCSGCGTVNKKKLEGLQSFF
jgi:hypothetical protein